MLPILNTIFVSGICFIVGYVSAKAYCLKGSQRLLFMGSAVLVFGATSLVAGWVILDVGSNGAVTLHDTGRVCFFDSLCS